MFVERGLKCLLSPGYGSGYRAERVFEFSDENGIVCLDKIVDDDITYVVSSPPKMIKLRCFIKPRIIKSFVYGEVVHNKDQKVPKDLYPADSTFIEQISIHYDGIGAFFDKDTWFDFNGDGLGMWGFHAAKDQNAIYEKKFVYQKMPCTVHMQSKEKGLFYEPTDALNVKPLYCLGGQYYEGIPIKDIVQVFFKLHFCDEQTTLQTITAASIKGQTKEPNFPSQKPFMKGAFQLVEGLDQKDCQDLADDLFHGEAKFSIQLDGIKHSLAKYESIHVDQLGTSKYLIITFKKVGS